MENVTRFVVILGVLAAGPAWATGTSLRTVYVDCKAAPGGTGARTSPYDTITTALPAARALSATSRVAIDVADGTCQHETLPLLLDFPVDLHGARLPRFDSAALPIGDQYRDTLITWTLPSPVPAGAAFVVITADDVRVAALSLDGKLPRGADNPNGAPPSLPIGIAVREAQGYVLDRLRVVGMAAGIRSEASSGLLAGTYVSASGGNAVLVYGAGAADPARVVVLNNRFDYRTNGLAMLGGTVASGPSPAGTSLHALVVRNDVVTTYTDTGPSNPAALRISPIIGDSRVGDVEATFLFNRISGTPAYSIMVHGGQPRRRTDGLHYTGALQLAFFGTVLDAAAQASSDVLISFTGARATELPCELDPASTRATCPLLMGNPPMFWEYLEASSYELWSGGELDGALIDHPEIEPVDGRDLDNLLVIDGEVIDNETFLVVP